MYVVFDLSDESRNQRTEYQMENVKFIPRIGEIISLHNGIRTECLSGEFQVSGVEHVAYQSQLEQDLHTGEGGIEGIRIRAERIQ